MEEYRRSRETELRLEQEKKEAKRAIRIVCVIGAIIGFLLLDYLFFLAILNRGLEEGKFPEVKAFLQKLQEERKKENENTKDYFELIEEKEELTVQLGTAYEKLYRLWDNDTRYLAKKNGMWGMVDIYGNEIVPIVYEYYSCSDNTGWVEFAHQGRYRVYDRNGRTIDNYLEAKKYVTGKTEDETGYRTVIACMGGMRVKTYLPEDTDADFYGISYTNMETWDTVYEAVGGYEDVGVFSLPDKEGRAAAIRGDGTENTLYLITAGGCESRELELPEGVYFRYFAFPGNYQWADTIFSNGWLRVYICDKTSDFLLYEDDVYMASLNVDTLELVRFPEEYQNFYMMYDEGYGELIALANYQENAAVYKYAICKGDRVLTEEKYERIVWQENYIIGVTETQTEIMDHEGVVLATYPLTGESFVNGKMIVYDGTGVYYINENLAKCSGYLLRGKVDDCFSAGVVIDGEWYLLEDKKAGETDVTSIPRGGTPSVLRENLPENLETVFFADADGATYINQSAIALQDGDLFTVIDYQGKTIVGTEHRYYYQYDEDCIGILDENLEGHVYDTEGNLLYTHNYVESGLTTEAGIVFSRYIQYRKGLRMEFDIAEDDADYYGVHYYNAETGALIFEAVSTEVFIGVSTMPDETGRAIVILNKDGKNIQYSITKDGYIENSGTQLNRGERAFYYSDFIDWRQSAMSEGWMKVLIADHIEGLLGSSENWQEVLFNADTQLTVPLPEKYQGYSDYYTASAKGLYYGITALTEEEYFGEMPETVYYAICCGSEILTEELYTWIQFDETYILAGNERFAHILDYEGKVLAEYMDISPAFWDGKLLAYDGTGVFLIKESDLSVCSAYLMKMNGAYCGVQSICGQDGVYLFLWEEETEE